MSVWQAAGAATAALTRTVTGAILAPHETQRRVVSGKTGTYSSAAPRKSKCASIDPGGEMATPFYGCLAPANLVSRCIHFLEKTGLITLKCPIYFDTIVLIFRVKAKLLPRQLHPSILRHIAHNFAHTHCKCGVMLS